MYRDSSHPAEQNTQRKEEPFFFHHESRLTTYGTDKQLADKQVPVRGVRGCTDNALVEIRDGNFSFPSQYLVVDKAAHIVKIDGAQIELSYKEFELLSYFMENQGIALSREKILNNVWNYDYFGDARTIDTHVKKLRSKLGEKGEYIRTIWGMGYKFEVDS